VEREPLPAVDAATWKRSVCQRRQPPPRGGSGANGASGAYLPV